MSSPIIKTVKDLVNPKIFIENAWLFGILALFLSMYGPRLQPKLPKELRNLFNNPLFRGVVIFLIIYLGNRDMSAALVTAVIFTITINMLTTHNILENVKNMLIKERFNNYGKPLNTCSLYTKGKAPQYPSSSDDQEINF
tara:strand:+ start:257 stop:676 length:420 start_codon:yes stop_codon:yes gene_type:complete